jgi:hypothetical protein
LTKLCRLCRLLPLLADKAHFEASEVIINSDWAEQDKEEADNLLTFIDKTLKKFDYATDDGYWFELTEKGIAAKNSGGHFAYLNKLAEKEKVDKERQRLSDEKLKFDVKNAKRIFKTYWWTFAFAIVSFIYVLVQIFLKVLEWLQPIHNK